ncbi:MAG: hypothetical protein WC756_05490 [Taibaiella sp.]|jgi:hypothetical protein
MKRIILFSLLCLAAKPLVAQNIFAYDDQAINRDNVGIFASFSINSSAPMIKRGDGYSHTAKGALSTIPAIGVFYQKGIGERLSIRGGVSIGYASYAYKYAQSFDSLTENFTPVLSSKFNKYTKVKHGSGFVLPQIDLGYIFGPFKKMYLLEVRGGIGLHAYLKQASDTIVSAEGNVTDPKDRFTYYYHSTERAEYGQPEVYGSVVTNIYVGLRWQKTMSNFLNHFSIGIQATIPVSTTNAGFSEIEYKNESYQVITREKVEMSLFNFGIRAAYSFL